MRWSCRCHHFSLSEEEVGETHCGQTRRKAFPMRQELCTGAGRLPVLVLDWCRKKRADEEVDTHREQRKVLPKMYLPVFLARLIKAQIAPQTLAAGLTA